MKPTIAVLALLLSFAARGEEGKPVNIQLLPGAEKSPVLVCVRPKSGEFICRDFIEVKRELESAGRLKIPKVPPREIDL